MNNQTGAGGGPGQFSRQTIPSSLQVGGGPVPANVDTNVYTAVVEDQAPTAGERPDQVPDALRPGGMRKETNPFLRSKAPQNPNMPPSEALANLDIGESETNPWNPAPKRQATTSSSLYSLPHTPAKEGQDFIVDPNRPPIPSIRPIFDPPDDPPNNQSFLQSPVEIQENPWSTSTTHIELPPQQPTLPPQPTGTNNPFAASSQNSAQASLQPSPGSMLADKDPFSATATAHSGHPTPPQPPPVPSPALMSVPSDDDADVWASEHDRSPKVREPVPQMSLPNRTIPDDDNIWDDLGSLDKGKGKAVVQPPAKDSAPTDDWNLIDVEPPSGPARGPQETPQRTGATEQQPSLTPQPSEEAGRWTSPRPPVDGQAETYQVKKIRWHDFSASENPRISPILIQAENGPCPLVALVNALTLTTPPNADDASLVTVLRSREQISLNLLLDAVFEELMSPRRTDADAYLPDVSDLYAFLQSLHTGMNVNPRYIPTTAMREAFQHTSLTHLDASERDKFIPGTFENTQEMGLYATFKIPLIHGWLPSSSDPVCEALERQANSYEDAQNLLFREEELDAKLSSPNGLDPNEQQLYQDLVTIKHFLSESATQLTAWGIHVISKAMRPGGFAILFRNDHFSTVYCHPQTKQLVTVVTDYGYRSHEEVVWESLVDINGERTQYLSGDFRVVGSAEDTTSFGGYSEERGGEWTTVDNRRGRSRPQQTPEQAPEEPALTAAEQEDRDLALALQLQEEEDQRHREELSRRQREQELSNRVIEQQGRQPQRVQREPPTIRNVSQGSGPAARNVSQGSALRPTSSNTSSRRPSSSIQITPAPATNNPPVPPRPTSQQVRSLVPPRRSMPPRRPEDGGDAPPPYEQAAQDEPYEPPPGHPNHPSSSPAMSRQTTTASGRSVPAAPIRQGQRISGQTAGLRPTAHSRDRDCTVM